MWNSRVMYTSLSSLICLIKWMTTIFIMLKMSDYNGNHMHENSLLFLCSWFKSKSSIKGINKLWLQMIICSVISIMEFLEMKCVSVWTLSRLQRRCLIWKSITRCKVTAGECITTQFGKNENGLSVLF